VGDGKNGRSWEHRAPHVDSAGMADKVVMFELPEENDPEMAWLDEQAARLRSVGCPAVEALRYARALRALRLVGGHGDDQEVSFAIERMESLVRVMLREIAGSDKPKLMARVNLIARGAREHRDESQRKLAAAWNLSPEAVSNMVEDAQKKYRFPKNDFNKSAEACERYRLTNPRGKKAA
jgi:hypothetical protein